MQSPFIVWAPSSYGRVAILWFRQNLDVPDPQSPPLNVSNGHLGPIQCTHVAPKAIWAQYSVHTWQVGWMSLTPWSPHWMSPKAIWVQYIIHIWVKSVKNALFNLVRCGNKRQRGGVDFALHLPQHCFWFYFVFAWSPFRISRSSVFSCKGREHSGPRWIRILLIPSLLKLCCFSNEWCKSFLLEKQNFF